MSLEEVTKKELGEVALYLDKFSDGHRSGEDEEFWRLLIKELKKATPASGGKKIRYKMVEVEDFATELLKNKSPSLKLLYDLQKKKLSLDVFIPCLEKIGCVGAQNVFRTAAPPVIIQHPLSQSLRTGEDIVLSCEAECQPPAKYFWFRDRKPIPNSNSESLVIRNANSGNSGWYVCRASNPNINDPKKCVFSGYAQVEVIGPTHAITQSPIQETDGQLPTLAPPTITLHPTHATVDLGGSAELECRAEGEGLIYDWYKDGRQFRHDQRHGKLIFDPVRPEDLGEYYCEVVNASGRVKTSHAKLAVSPSITITEHPKDCSGRVGTGITLRCFANGPPQQSLVYQWFKKQPGDKDKEILGKDSVCYAEIFFTPRVEYKIYCKVSLAVNKEVAVQSKVATVTVDSIWITRQPQSIDRYIGDRASLTCCAESYKVSGRDQKISYTWLRSDTPGSKRQHVLTCNSGLLLFERLGQKNWGYYVCQAENNYQHVQSEEVYVKVSAPPIDGSRAKDRARPMIRFTKHPWPQVVPLGGRFRLLCEAHSTGDEPLHHQWYFNGVPLDGETGDKLIRKRVLNSHLGSYFCEVRTNEGFAKSITSTARIELAPPQREERHRITSGLQLEQQEAERFLITAKEERYAREKVALLIGNQRYESKDMTLSIPENDTRELAEKLRSLNFKVFSFVNLNFREMMDALEVFYGMLTLSGIYALFYYTGHGFSHGGVTYLMPVDATLPPSCDCSIAADDIGAHMQNKMSRAVKILDCCQISDREDIESPTHNRTASLGYSNIVEITSCLSGQASYENKKEPNSIFNVALRGALESRRKMSEVFEKIQDNMRKAPPQSQNGKPYQGPMLRSSLADAKITLYDDVMLDDPAAEEKLYEIGHKWEQAHTLPDPVLLSDELGGLLSVELNFSSDFSNVLVVRIILIPAGSCTSATVDVDTAFLEGQGLRGELYLQADAPPDHPTHTIATLKVANLQRLKGSLKLCLNVSVTEPGRGKKNGTVVHELDQRPLYANIQ